MTRSDRTLASINPSHHKNENDQTTEACEKFNSLETDRPTYLWGREVTVLFILEMIRLEFLGSKYN